MQNKRKATDNFFNADILRSKVNNMVTQAWKKRNANCHILIKVN